MLPPKTVPPRTFASDPPNTSANPTPGPRTTSSAHPGPRPHSTHTATPAHSTTPHSTSHQAPPRTAADHQQSHDRRQPQRTYQLASKANITEQPRRGVRSGA